MACNPAELAATLSATQVTDDATRKGAESRLKEVRSSVTRRESGSKHPSKAVPWKPSLPFLFSSGIVTLRPFGRSATLNLFVRPSVCCPRRRSRLQLWMLSGFVTAACSLIQAAEFPAAGALPAWPLHHTTLSLIEERGRADRRCPHVKNGRRALALETVRYYGCDERRTAPSRMGPVPHNPTLPRASVPFCQHAPPRLGGIKVT